MIENVGGGGYTAHTVCFSLKNSMKSCPERDETITGQLEMVSKVRER